MISDPLSFDYPNVSEIRRKLLEDPGFRSLMRAAEHMKKQIGEEKYIGLMTSAPFSLAGTLIGVQNLMELFFEEDPEALEPLFRFAADLGTTSANILLECGCNLACISDPVASGDLISPAVYKNIAFPQLQQVLGKYTGAEKKILHICGNTLPRLPILTEADIDGFSLDSIDLRTALEIAKGHYAIMGTMSPIHIMKDMTPSQIKTICTELCAIAGTQNGGFVMMPGCDMAVGTPPENILAMVDASKEYANN